MTTALHTPVHRIAVCVASHGHQGPLATTGNRVKLATAPENTAWHTQGTKCRKTELNSHSKHSTRYRGAMVWWHQTLVSLSTKGVCDQYGAP